MRTTIKVKFSDACTDMLVWLAALDEHQWRCVEQIADAVAPADAESPRRTASNALGTLRECGLVRFQKIDSDVTWQITDEGRAAIREASHISTRVDDLPADRAARPSAPRRRSRVVADLAANLRARLAELTRPRFHTWCGETHVPGPCADGVTRPPVTPSRTDRQPPASASETKGGLSAVGPDETKQPDSVTHHEET